MSTNTKINSIKYLSNYKNKLHKITESTPFYYKGIYLFSY